VVLDPPVPGRERLSQMLYETASKSGAKSLRQSVGELTVGKPADFVGIDLDDLSVAGASPETLVANVVFSLERTAVKEVYVGGLCVVTDGRHPLQEKVTAEFRGVQERFWKS
jgi:cytosine/adenosine deaminase-related metal-dependent hydrolase